MFEFASKSLSDSRDQLHWAAQLLSATADATLEKAPDDSHSNVGWNSTTNRLESRADCNLDVIGFTLEYGGDSFELNGSSIGDAATWLGDRLQKKIEFRTYEMPQHPVSEGEPFAPEQEQLEAVANWFSFAQQALAGHGELRIWPHHFDMGFWSPGLEEGKSIGGGFSLGDHDYDQPYFYINPYGIDKPDSLPNLKYGNWTVHWFGAVLTRDELVPFEDPASLAAGFVESAHALSERLISD